MSFNIFNTTEKERICYLKDYSVMSIYVVIKVFIIYSWLTSSLSCIILWATFFPLTSSDGFRNLNNVLKIEGLKRRVFTFFYREVMKKMWNFRTLYFDPCPHVVERKKISLSYKSNGHCESVSLTVKHGNFHSLNFFSRLMVSQRKFRNFLPLPLPCILL